jgi:hypothetical protein
MSFEFRGEVATSWAGQRADRSVQHKGALRFLASFVDRLSRSRASTHASLQQAECHRLAGAPASGPRRSCVPAERRGLFLSRVSVFQDRTAPKRGALVVDLLRSPSATAIWPQGAAPAIAALPFFLRTTLDESAKLHRRPIYKYIFCFHNR